MGTLDKKLSNYLNDKDTLASLYNHKDNAMYLVISKYGNNYTAEQCSLFYFIAGD